MWRNQYGTIQGMLSQPRQYCRRNGSYVQCTGGGMETLRHKSKEGENNRLFLSGTTGTLPELFEKGMSFLKANLHNIQAGQGFNSIGKLEISEVALEEILQNALVHRDYTRNAPIRLLIFDNRVEIISPGCLPDGLTVESIKLGSAVVRNPFIANFCAKTMPYRGLGSGIIRALQEEPNIKFINEPAGMQFISIIDRIADEGVNENEGINELESLILTFLEKKPGAKGYEIAEYIQKGAATTERYLRSLKDKELIEYKGSRKTGGYYKK